MTQEDQELTDRFTYHPPTTEEAMFWANAAIARQPK